MEFKSITLIKKIIYPRSKWIIRRPSVADICSLLIHLLSQGKPEEAALRILENSSSFGADFFKILQQHESSATSGLTLQYRSLSLFVQEVLLFRQEVLDALDLVDRLVSYREEQELELVIQSIDKFDTTLLLVLEILISESQKKHNFRLSKRLDQIKEAVGLIQEKRKNGLTSDDIRYELRVRKLFYHLMTKSLTTAEFWNFAQEHTAIITTASYLSIVERVAKEVETNNNIP